jgi:hypothetical protein
MPERPLSDLRPMRAAPSATSAAGLGLGWLPPAERRPALGERALARHVERLAALPPGRQRTKIWEFGSNLHCSILGTCLSTGELRQVLGKIGLKEAATTTEHDVHASGVLIAGKHHDGARLLHKALDRRHRVAINRFDKAKSADEIRVLWREFAQSGDIPGAYWAALTHPATTDALVREVFTEVHMLSHLVGAANRADIRRLRQLEAENAELAAKTERQQRQLRDAVVSRDTTIRELRCVLEAHIEHSRETVAAEATAASADNAGWQAVAADLKARLTRSETRRAAIERQFAATRATLASERDARIAGEQRERALRDEIEAIEAIEASLAVFDDADQVAAEARGELTGLTLLYVGGRPGQIAHIRAAAERQGAVLLHHDGGVEERGGLLPGLVSRADAVLFPVDCVSHTAMSLVKRLCQQTAKPFLPLRSGGLAPFCAALQTVARRDDKA